MSGMGDKAPYRLGPELVTNGDFSDGLTGWTAGSFANLSVVGGQLVVECDPGDSFCNAYQAVQVEKGKRYEFSGVNVSKTYGMVSKVDKTSLSSDYIVQESSAVPYKKSFVSDMTGEVFVQLCCSGDGRQAVFDRVSLREMIFEDFILGPELFVDPIWTTDNVVFENGLWVFGPAISQPPRIQKYNVFETDGLYRVEILSEGFDQDAYVNPYLHSANLGTINDEGKRVFIGRATGSIAKLLCYGNGGIIKSISYRKIIG